MKVEVKKEEKVFKPFTLIITIESKEELKAIKQMSEMPYSIAREVETDRLSNVYEITASFIEQINIALR